MAIIDLGTGQAAKDEQAQPEVAASSIIDLNTGSMVAPPQVDTAPTFGETQVTPFPEQRGETRAAEELPELGQGGLLSGEDAIKGAKLAPVLLSTTDDAEVANIITQNFPNIGQSFSPGGEILLTNNKTGSQIIVNKPGLSKIDMLRGLGIVAAFTPAAKLATIGTTSAVKATAPVVAQRVAQGGAASTLTQASMEAIQEQVGGELNQDEIVIAGALGGIAETVVPVIQAIRQSRQASRLGAATDEIDQVAGNIRVAQEASEETGIPLFQAQQTLIPAQLEKQAFVAQLPAGTRASIEGLRIQNRAAGDAVESFLGQIAPDDAVITGADQVRTAAQSSIDAIKRLRKEASSPIYKQAFRRQRKGQLDLIDTSALETKITQMARQFDPKGQISKNLMEASNKIESAAGNLQKLHFAKIELDQTVNSFGADAVGNTTKRFLNDVVRDLTGDLAAQSPSYRAAKDEFVRLSPAVTKVQESIVGKIANLDDTQLKQVTSKIFDPANTVKNVLDAKKAITDVSPDAWNAIVRRELEGRIGGVSADASVGAIDNIPGQLFRAIFPNKKKTDALFNALDAESKKNLKYMQSALKLASQGRPGGSQTAAREEIKRELRGGIFQSLRVAFKNPINTLLSTGEDAAFNKRVKALSEAMFDPTWKAEMRALRRFSPKSPEAGRALTQLLSDIESTQKDKTEPQ